MATLVSTPPITLEEFSQLPGDGQIHEIAAGELITMPFPKSLHTLIAHRVYKALQPSLNQYDHSEALFEAGYILSLAPLTVRQPDVSVLTKERIHSTALDSYFEGAPEIAIEIVSPSDSAEYLEAKVKDYLESGSTEVWILYPKTKHIHVFSRTDAPKLFTEKQTLESSDLLPGFSVKVADLFL